MFKLCNKLIRAAVFSMLISSPMGMVYADITPAVITPPTITPATVTPTQITPQVITPQVIIPTTITPANTIPNNTTPNNTTPPIIVPAQVYPGGTSSAGSTSTQIPGMIDTDAEDKKKNEQLPAGMIVKLSGTADDLKSNKKIHHLKVHSLFFVHDIIITRKDSNVALLFNDGSFVVLGADSALEIKKFRFTIPSKGKAYQGAPKDRAVIKLLQGNLKAKLGSLAKANKPRAFAILTPRGRIVLSDPAKSPNVDLIYNNRIGLAVKAVGLLNNAKGQVILTDKIDGLVSAIVGSSPTTTTIAPLAFSDLVITHTNGFFNSQISEINTVYNEKTITEEKAFMSSDASDSAADTNAKDADIALSNQNGDDDGDSGDDDIDDNSDDDSDDDSADEDSGDE
jgi:hypothetical protein